MVKICFINQHGIESILECSPGESLMAAAVRHGLTEVIGECGGNCACATCHVYLREPWSLQVPPPEETERAMLDGVLDPRGNSRLGCCIQITPSLDGMLVDLPSRQV